MDLKDSNVILQLPAFLNLKYEQPGDYVLELSLEKTVDVEAIM